MSDVNETSYCPSGARCESCGRNDDPQVAIRIYEPTGETYCITLCPRCRVSDVPPRIQDLTAGRFIAQHRAHLQGGW
jgi:hypothetical protein